MRLKKKEEQGQNKKAIKQCNETTERILEWQKKEEGMINKKWKKLKKRIEKALRKNGQEKEQKQATRNGRIGAAREQTG